MNRSSFLAPCALLSTALMLPAQWVEVGDAGQLPPGAQIPVGVGPLTTIAGTLTANNADMYLIQIANPTAFSASTVGGSTVDTQLFLFDEHGRGVTSDDDTAASVQSTITSSFVLVPGRYYLAISAYNSDPIANGQLMWNNSPFGTERAPDGPGRGAEINGWAGTSGAGAYTITLAGTAFPGRQVLLPDNHHLGKSATQAQATGSANWWGGATVAGRRFMVLYEGSHFTGVGGVAGPIGITHLRFRGEDTEHNVGGQTYAGVTVNVYRTPLTTATYNPTTFATNIAASALIGTLTLAAAPLTVARSLGTAPNNYNIDLDFGAPLAPFNPVFDNLLIDVSYTSAAAAPDPQASTMISIQDTAGTTAFIRGTGTYAAAPAALTGTSSLLPPVIGVEYGGPGGGGFPILIPATTERYGAACGGAPSSFYQLFPTDQPFDLGDPGQVDGLSGLTMTPDVYPNPAFYIVTGGAAPVDLTNGLLAAPTTQGDDDTMVHNLPIGVAFDYPGGSTTVIRAASNGYVIVAPNSTEGSAVPGNFASDFSPTVAEFLGTAVTNLARFAPFWHDLSPNKNTTAPFGDPLAGLHVVNNVAGNEVLVTWNRVGRYNSVIQVFQESHTMQCSMNWVTGVVQFRYASMDRICGDTFSGTTSAIVGFTRGNIGGVPSVDPQSRDLSVERPFRTRIEGATGNMGLTAASTPTVGGPIYMGRAFAGQSLNWNANNVPAGSLLGVQLLDIAASRPGFSVPGIVAPGCMLSTSSGATLWEITFFPPPVVNGTVPFFIPPGFSGVDLFAQYVVLDGVFGAPNLITVASNAVKHTVGLQ